MKVRILKEVSSEKQRKYMCAMKDASADERPDGLSKDEADEMCRSDIKEQNDDLYIGGSGSNDVWGPTKEEKRKKAVENLGFVEIKQIGQGNFGTVFKATEGEGKFRDAAVKVLDKSGSHAKKEVKNYAKVSQARQQNKSIARHFPEVYDIIETDDHVLIVMELLDSTSAGMAVVGDFLQGPEGVYRVGRPNRSMKDIDKMYKDAYGDEAGLMKTDITGRVKNMFLDPKALEEIVSKFTDEFPIDTSGRQNVIKNILSSSRGIINAKDQVAERNVYELEDTLLQVGAIEPDTLSVIMKDLESDMSLMWLIMIMIKEIYTNAENKENFSARVGFGIRNLILKIRQTSAVPVVFDDFYSDEQIKNAEPGAESLMMAINSLMQMGIIPHDVHDKNALIRPNTGDIVIVDLGNFQEMDVNTPPPLNETVRLIKVFIDKKR